MAIKGKDGYLKPRGKSRLTQHGEVMSVNRAWSLLDGIYSNHQINRIDDKEWELSLVNPNVTVICTAKTLSELVSKAIDLAK